MDHRRHDRQLVAAELRAGPVPLHSTTHHQTEGAPKVVLGAAARAVVLCGAEELQAGGGASV